jgi:hypothetical protein
MKLIFSFILLLSHSLVSANTFFAIEKVRCNFWGKLKITMSTHFENITFKHKFSRSECKVIKKELEGFKNTHNIVMNEKKSIEQFESRRPQRNFYRSHGSETIMNNTLEFQCDTYEITTKYFSINVNDKTLKLEKSYYKILNSKPVSCHHHL